MAPPVFLSALLSGCGFVGSPLVPAVPDVEWLDDFFGGAAFVGLAFVDLELFELLAFELPLAWLLEAADAELCFFD